MVLLVREALAAAGLRRALALCVTPLRHAVRACHTHMQLQWGSAERGHRQAEERHWTLQACFENQDATGGPGAVTCCKPHPPPPSLLCVASNRLVSACWGHLLYLSVHVPAPRMFVAACF